MVTVAHFQTGIATATLQLAVFVIAVLALPPLTPETECGETGDYFDSTLLRCGLCRDVDPRSTPTEDVPRSCRCQPGLVQCGAGESCFARDPTGSPNQEVAVVASGPVRCLDCPQLSTLVNQTAPTKDLRRCLQCHVGPTGDHTSTLGYSQIAGDCVCPPGHALVERGEDGRYLTAKRCVRCAEDTLPGPRHTSSTAYGCRPCPDERRMHRSAETGECVCRPPGSDVDSDGAGFVFAGGSCVDTAEFDAVNTRFPESSAVEVRFRDAIDGNEESWRYGPFGHHLGIEIRDDDTMSILAFEKASASETIITSAIFKWLYVRCSVGCLRGNMTACQCISNLCVLVLYEDESTVCRFITRHLYEGRSVASPETPGRRSGMPWILYDPQRPQQTLEDSSVLWRFTLGEGEDSRTTSMMEFWLAQYSLEGSWLGWTRVESQLELCNSLGGGSAVPRSESVSWRRFGSSLTIHCKMPLSSLLRCGAEPIFYELFIENVDGTLVPVPVRILNTVQARHRPNLNSHYDDIANDVLVRRFVLCDAVSGKNDGANAYLSNIRPQMFRWAAHMAVEVRIRPGGDAGIYVPVLQIAYAEKTTAKLSAGQLTSVSFRSEYSMDPGSFWTWMIVLIVLASVFALALAVYRMYIVERRYPTLPEEANAGTNPGLFAPKPVLQALAFFCTAFNVLFWFHLCVAMYWLIFFKGQDVPYLLLPSPQLGDQYKPHDVMLVLVTSVGAVCVGIGLYRQLKVFIFLIDWERGAPLRDGEVPRRTEAEEESLVGAMFTQGGVPQHGLMQQGGYGQQVAHQVGQQFSQTQAYPYGGQAQQFQSGGVSRIGSAAAQMVGSPLLGGGGSAITMATQQALAAQAAQAAAQTAAGSGMSAPADFPDRGISAWRSLFVCNELNRRLASTRTLSYITWLGMATLLEGCNWKQGARWFPSYFISDEAIVAARFNPALQHALGILVWLFVIISQIVLRWAASILVGDRRTDFRDVCSVANISVLFLDEPFHGFYIHGKAPSSRGEWCHTELSKVLNDEDKGIGFNRGLTVDGCQTFQVYLPIELAVPIPGGGVISFRQTLYRMLAEVNVVYAAISKRTPAKASDMEVAELSQHRCAVQLLMDATIHAVIKASREVIQVQRRLERLMGAPPPGGVALLRQPVFYEDRDGLAWSSCLAYGSELRLGCIGIPTGFEWHLISLELLIFLIMWRFAEAIFWGVFLAFLLNQLVLKTYAFLGRKKLAHTTIINPMFLI